MPPKTSPGLAAGLTYLRVAAWIFGLLFAFLPAAAQEEPVPTAPAAPAGLPAELTVEFENLKQTGEGDFEFTGEVTIIWRGSRIQADRIRLENKRHLTAEGNVLVVWGGNRIFGRKMVYDLETERGVLDDAMGQMEGDYLFTAKTAEKIGSDQVRIKKATVTTCTQPVPYWSFSVTSATIRVDGYAKMWNVRLRGSKAPLVYLPYIIWPVKKNRAAGLLMPEFNTTETRGSAVSQELFIPLGRSADLTVLGRYYTDAGFGGGGELRLVPNNNGSASFNGFFINDKVSNANRYRAEYRQTQQFLNGFRMVADINLVSDFNYFSDFERELNLVSSPTILAKLEFSRNGPWTSMNVRELRREQLRSDGTSLIQQTLPEIEWRGRNRRLGKSPFYFSYESSLASIQQDEGVDFRPDYLRGDLFPTISAPLSPADWLDITPRVSYRATHYTERQQLVVDNTGSQTRQIVDDSLTRQFWGAGIEVSGPKIARIYDRPDNPYSTQYKHAIEPRLTYAYGDEFDRSDEIILFDEVDRFSGAGNRVTYSVVQRLFAKRPRKKPRLDEDGPEAIVMPDGTTRESDDETALDEPAAELERLPAQTEAVEIATLELRQSRSFENLGVLSQADLDSDGVNDTTSRSSSVTLFGRFNPNPTTSLDLRSDYNILYKDFSNVTVSGSLQSSLARLRFSFVHRNGLGVRNDGTSAAPLFVPIENDTQLRLTTGVTLFGGKLRLDLDGSYDANPVAGGKRFPDKRWRIQYSSQCCSVMLERLDRDYTSSADRDDFYFRVDLKGVGKILKFNY